MFRTLLLKFLRRRFLCRLGKRCFFFFQIWELDLPILVFFERGLRWNLLGWSIKETGVACLRSAHLSHTFFYYPSVILIAWLSLLNLPFFLILLNWWGLRIKGWFFSITDISIFFIWIYRFELLWLSHLLIWVIDIL